MKALVYRRFFNQGLTFTLLFLFVFCFVVFLENIYSIGKDTLWIFSFRAFQEIQFQGHFMNQEMLSRNTFTLVSPCHCVCFSWIQKLNLQRKDIFWQRKSNSINFDKYLLLKNKNKKIKKTKTYLNQTMAKKQER